MLLEVLLSPGARGLDDALLGRLRDQVLAGGTRADLMLGAQAALQTRTDLTQTASRLQQWAVAQPKDAMAWQMLSRVQAALGQRLRSVRSEAEARAAQLDYAGAADRLRAAQLLPVADRNADPMELAIVDVRKREMEALARESERDSAREE